MPGSRDTPILCGDLRTDSRLFSHLWPYPEPRLDQATPVLPSKTASHPAECPYLQRTLGEGGVLTVGDPRGHCTREPHGCYLQRPLSPTGQASGAPAVRLPSKSGCSLICKELPV